MSADQGPDGPTLALAVVAILHLVNAALVVAADPENQGRFFNPMMVSGALSGLGGLLTLGIAADAMRRGRRAAAVSGVGVLGAVGLAFVFGYAWSPVTGWRVDAPMMLFLGTAGWSFFTVPLAVGGVGPSRRVPAAVMVLALAVFLVLAGPAMLADSAVQRSTFGPPDEAAAQAAGTLWRRLAEGLAEIVFAAGIALAIGHPARRLLPKPRPVAGLVPSGWWVAAVVLWVMAVVLRQTFVGGWLWPLVPLAVAAPLLVAARAHPRRSASAVAVLVLGFLPLLPCAYTDTFGGGPPSPIPGIPFEAAVSGPSWSVAGIDSLLITDCGWLGFGLGFLALAALAALASTAALRTARAGDGQAAAG